MLGVLKVANRLSYSDLLKYMEIVLDMEKNVYIEEQTWKYLNNQANNLGIKKIYKEPKKSNVDTSGCGSFIGCGTVMGIAATGLTVLHSTCTSSCLAPLEEGFWNKPITIGVSVFLICLVIILIMFLAEKKDKDNQYEQDMKKYKKNMENDRVRVERELKQKRYIQTQCNTLAQMYQKSRNALDTIYSYDILEKVGLAKRVNNFPPQLSGGEQQRVSIARALVKDADIILCDEPTGALDDKTGRKILELLQNIVREEGRTMIIVTHTTPIAGMANRIITLKNGKIIKEKVNEHPIDAKDIDW